MTHETQSTQRYYSTSTTSSSLFAFTRGVPMMLVMGNRRTGRREQEQQPYILFWMRNLIVFITHQTGVWYGMVWYFISTQYCRQYNASNHPK
mmetsp:Transcript_59502/g.64243  ORF Transcript_59502/g.64243 Transcript_59502/m.64243 type:complete len:92 (+) Transcript_59502:346-621(+)